ncbi:MAG: hypothetical protein B6I20_08035 [Bacteroidetes bacterium 4572_117]|nr:MAG: hypothetical protein B6I20_08035 [Bacteroidetes bacterium 4572_117]
MRFEMAGGWSRWVTVGYWDKNIWPTYGYTSFTGGKVAIDYVKLDYYITNYQFKVNFKRNNTSYKSPSIEQLSFFVSDTRTTDNADIDAIVNDNPAAILITTDFVYQYGVDDVIGGSICSPSTVSMIIKSYDIDVDTYDFAVRTKDPYWEIFGVWPRIVQHAAEYGLQGSVTRYRNWDAAYQVLNNGGRIAITVGPPLYSGHLIMLAGFDNNGTPIVHDPAKSNGYSYRHNKRSLTESWFNKGGISYTFYKKENATFAGNELFVQNTMLNVYPNPIVDKATIELELKRGQAINLKIYNIQGQCIQVIKQNEYLPKGKHRIQLDFNRNFETVSGFYILNLRSRTENINVKLIKTLR